MYTHEFTEQYVSQIVRAACFSTLVVSTFSPSRLARGHRVLCAARDKDRGAVVSSYIVETDKAQETKFILMDYKPKEVGSVMDGSVTWLSEVRPYGFNVTTPYDLESR